MFGHKIARRGDNRIVRPCCLVIALRMIGVCRQVGLVGMHIRLRRTKRRATVHLRSNDLPGTTQDDPKVNENGRIVSAGYFSEGTDPSSMM